MLLIDENPIAIKLIEDITEVIDYIEEQNFLLDILRFELLFWNDEDGDMTKEEAEALEAEFRYQYSDVGSDPETTPVEDLLLNYLGALEDIRDRFIADEEAEIEAADTNDDEE